MKKAEKSKQEPHWPKAPTLSFGVTQRRIDGAIRLDSGHCMIADGFKDAYPWAKSVSVDLQSIRASDPRSGLRYIWMTPHPIGQHLLDWDYGTKPKPFPVRLKGNTAIVIEMARGRAKKKGGRSPMPKKASFRKNGGSVPRRVGGKEPPKYTGIRTFGLRNFKYTKQAAE